MSLMQFKIRGFRLIDMTALVLLIGLMLAVYLAKTMAGGERSQIARVDRQIGIERQRVRLLEAEVAHLETPARIERLASDYLGMGPVPTEREITPEELAAHVVEDAPKARPGGVR